jgi:REP element-mobilizing transposase RayT
VKKMEKELPVRKHPRLKGYDYSNNGIYYITFCVENGHEMLASVGRDDPGAPCLELNEYGLIAKKYIENIEKHYNGVIIDKYVVMTHHIHLIIQVERNGAPGSSRPTTALIPNIIAAFKKLTNKEFGFNMWQTSFYDEIIRNEQAYHNIWQYIDENPIKWAEDKYYKEEK